MRITSQLYHKTCSLIIMYTCLNTSILFLMKFVPTLKAPQLKFISYTGSQIQQVRMQGTLDQAYNFFSREEILKMSTAHRADFYKYFFPL